MLYPEHEFLDRFAAAAADGFKAVEYLFPYAHEAQVLAARLRDHGLQQVLFNGPPGDWERGERGIACAARPRRRISPRRSTPALTYAQALRLPARARDGRAGTGGCRARAAAAPPTWPTWPGPRAQAAGAGIDVLIEPINTRDIPGFFLNRQDEAHRIVQEVGAPNLKVQMDLYHCQIVEGDVAMKIRQYLPTGRVGHLQIAGVPERHEPDVGEVNYAYLFNVIDEVSASCGWDGWVGCEYRPRRGAVSGGTSAGLGWLRALRR